MRKLSTRITLTSLASLTVLLSSSLALAGEAVRYTVGDAPYEGWIERADEPRGFVLILHDWDGLTDYEIQRAEMLAALGYDVFAADLFGAGIRPTENRDRRQHTGELYADRAKMRSLMLGAIETAAARGIDVSRAVAMGYCFGGAAVLELARAGAPMTAFATFHGGLSTPEGQDYSETGGKVLVYHGSADTAITLEDFARLGTELEAQGVSHVMTTYSAAPHAFTVFGSSRYQKTADEHSWASFTDYLDSTFDD